MIQLGQMKKMGVGARLGVFGLLALGLMLVDVWGVDRELRGWVEGSVVVAKASVYEIWGQVRSLGSFRVNDREIARLRSQILDQNSLSGQVATLSAENTSLKNQLGVKTRVSGTLFMAYPIGLSGGEMTISVGSGQGVMVGQTVVYGQVLVGKVSEVSAGQSVVRLPVYEGEKVSAVVRSGGVDGVRKASGIVVSSGGQLILDKVTLGEALSVGDLVMTAGDGHARDLLIGSVAEVMEKENELFKRGRVEPAADYGRLDRVFVLLEKTP